MTHHWVQWPFRTIVHPPPPPPSVPQVWARRLQVANPSLTIPVSGTITTEQVMKEALARFRLGEDVAQYQLVKVTLEAGRGECA